MAGYYDQPDFSSPILGPFMKALAIKQHMSDMADRDVQRQRQAELYKQDLEDRERGRKQQDLSTALSLYQLGGHLQTPQDVASQGVLNSLTKTMGPIHEEAQRTPLQTALGTVYIPSELDRYAQQRKQADIQAESIGKNVTAQEQAQAANMVDYKLPDYFGGRTIKVKPTEVGPLEAHLAGQQRMSEAENARILATQGKSLPYAQVRQMIEDRVLAGKNRSTERVQRMKDLLPSYEKDPRWNIKPEDYENQRFDSNARDRIKNMQETLGADVDRAMKQEAEQEVGRQMSAYYGGGAGGGAAAPGVTSLKGRTIKKKNLAGAAQATGFGNDIEGFKKYFTSPQVGGIIDEK